MTLDDTETRPPRLIRLHFPEGGNWSRWYSTSEAAVYLSKTDAAMRGWVRRYRDGRDQFLRDGIEVRRHGAKWLLRFDRSWNDE